jgi:hypothetical protein
MSRAQGPIGLTFGVMPPFEEFIRDIRRPDPDYDDERAYWPEGATYPMELVDSDEIDLANQFIRVHTRQRSRDGYGNLTPFASRHSHKAGFRADNERALYDFIEFLASSGEEAGESLASSIMTTLGYEWI